LKEAGLPKLLASPRKRRRLGWAATTLAFLGVVGLLIVLLPGRPDEGGAPLVEGGTLPPEPEPPYRRRNRDLVAPLVVAEYFVSTAVTRKNLAASWDVLSPTFPGKSEFTKKQWSKAKALPFVPFDADRAKWRPDYSLKNEVGFKVALFPPKNSEQSAAVFDIALVRRGHGKNRRWLVDYFSPTGQTISTGEARAAGGGGANRATGLPNLDPTGVGQSHRISTAWIFVPIGILGLAVLFPLGLGVAYVFRVKRAERDFARAP
jgi:hypothetical protein